MGRRRHEQDSPIVSFVLLLLFVFIGIPIIMFIVHRNLTAAMHLASSPPSHVVTPAPAGDASGE